MTLKGKERYCTLFCPKYCAAAGRATRSAVAPTTAAPSTLSCRIARSVLSPCLPEMSHFAQRHGWRVSPQPLELVKLPQLRVEEMHDDIHVIEQHPAPLRQAFHVMGMHTLHQVLGHAPDVGVGGAGGDDEIVG